LGNSDYFSPDGRGIDSSSWHFYRVIDRSPGANLECKGLLLWNKNDACLYFGFACDAAIPVVIRLQSVSIPLPGSGAWPFRWFAIRLRRGGVRVIERNLAMP